jgi:hypothetical protein
MLSKILFAIALLMLVVFFVFSLKQKGNTKFQAIAFNAMMFLAAITARYIGW